MFVVACCGTALMLVFTLLDALQGADEQAGLSSALLQTARTIPRKVEEIAPFAVFLGALLGMGSLSSNSELTVFRAAGVSVFRLFLSTCIPAILMIILALMLIPNLFATNERGDTMTLDKSEGAWIREGDHYTRIDAIGDDLSLQGISQFQFDDQGALQKSLWARTAIEDPQGEGWHLFDVRETSIKADQVLNTLQDEARWETPRSADSLHSVFTTQPRKMSLLQLREQIDDLTATGQDPIEFQVEFWQKLVKPLSVLGLVLIALCFVVGSTREMGMGARLTFGIAVGFTFHYFQSLVAPLTVVFALPPMVVICVPIVLIWLIGLIMIRRVS